MSLPRALMIVGVSLVLAMWAAAGAALALGRGVSSARLQVALYSARDGDGEIYRMDAPDSNSIWSRLWGSITVRLSRSEGWDASPARSPDNGDFIAFESGRDGGLNLYLMGANGGDVRRLTTGADSSRNIDPAWSPDGTRIAFASNRSGEWDLYVLDVEHALNNPTDGDGALQLTDDEFQDETPAWSPDGRQIAYVSWHAENFQIFLIDVPTTDAGFVSNATPPDGPPPRPQPRALSDRRARYVEPTWSPDGRWLAFASDRLERNFEIYAMDMHSGDILRLTDDSAWDARPSWSADGRSLFFESYREDNWDIYALDMPPTSDMPAARRLTFDPGRDAEAN